MKLLSALLVLAPIAASAGTCLHYDLPNVAFEGLITRGELQVAPGKGDGSDDDYRWYIDPSESICVSGDANNLSIVVAKHVLVWPGAHMHIGKYAGSTVKATGYFMPTWIPHFHAYPIFAVESIHIVRGKTP